MFTVNVPNVPGVPNVSFSASTGSSLVDLLISDALDLFNGAFGSQQPWGIYQGGSPVVSADTVTAFEYQQAWSLLDYPVERGGFASYNKVYVPFIGSFRFSTGGSQAARQAMLDSINAIAGDTNLYDIVTPEAVYTNVSVMQQSYPRSAESGLGLLSIDVRAQEVRLLGASSQSNTASPSNAAQINTGTVQGVLANSSGSPDERGTATSPIATT